MGTAHTRKHTLNFFPFKFSVHLNMHVVFRRYVVVANVRENCQSNRLTDRSPLKR